MIISVEEFAHRLHESYEGNCERCPANKEKDCEDKLVEYVKSWFDRLIEEA